MSQAPDRRALLKDALRAVEEMKAKLDAVEHARHEPIAVIGVGCRFPGGADSPELLWRALEQGVDAITEVPESRWTFEDYRRLNAELAAKIPTQYGGFLNEIDRFDAGFFGISGREALSLDPQQRLVLEVAWEALEDAGQAPHTLRDTKGGVFLGITTNDYLQHMREADPSRLDVYTATGNVHNAAAGRLSFTLGLRGPAMAIDTACSSSLTAVHLACQSLRLGESDLAITGGVNVLLLPEIFMSFFKWGMMAPDGRCKTFDAAADGFVRAEGCGMIVLKRLSDAIAQNDHILAVIRGSAVNQDGASSGLTVPNGPAQEAVLREALRAARVAPADVGYVEAHGTGTTLGDPIELEALDAVLSEGRPADRTLTVGSIKTNVGHLEAASGIAGLIKVVLSLQHERIPRHLHFKTLNPHITLRKLDVVVPQQSTPWPSGRGPRIAGVSSFGFSGTNAHVVIEEAPAGTRPGASAERPLHVLTISARSESALAEQAGRWAQRLETRSSDPVADVAYTANAGRTHFAHRAAIVAKSTDHAREQLMAIAKGETPPDTVRAHVTKAEAPKIAFLFTGQGSQYIGMGRQLYDTQPTFRAAIDRCEGLLRDQLERPLLSVLYPESGQTSPLDDTAFTQPSLFALEFALAELWRSWGVEPAFVMGHSVGEFAAACVAGAFSLEDAVKLIAARGRLMQKLPRGGAMAAVLAGEAQVKAALAPHGAALSIAAINGPSSVVISGEERALLAALDVLAKQGVSSQRLTVSHAFHSTLMEPMLDEFEQVARQVRPGTPRIRIVSNVTGRLAAADEFAQPSYWRKHARQAVRFFDGIQTLYNLGVRDFLEIGPSPTLVGMARQFTDADGVSWLASLRRGRTDWQEVLSSVSALYARGVDIDWRRFDGDYSRRRLQMPTYPFERQRYWIDKPESAAQVSELSTAAATSADLVHPLLGRRIPSALKDMLYESRLSAESVPFVADHEIFGSVVFPATGFLELARAAAADALGDQTPALENVVFSHALVLPAGRAVTLQTVLQPGSSGTTSFQIFSSNETDQSGAATWLLHVSGTIGQQEEMVTSPSLADAQHHCAQPLDVESIYARYEASGISYGPVFRGMSALWRGDMEALGQVRLPDGVETDGYQISPPLMDACLQVLAGTAGDTADPYATYIPIGLERLTLTGPLDREVWSYARFRRSGHQAALTADIRLFDRSGQTVAEATGLQLRLTTRDDLLRALKPAAGDWFYEIEWRPRSTRAEAGAEVDGARTWLVLADRGGVGEAVARSLESRGFSVVTAFAGSSAEGADFINPNAPEDFRRICRASAGNGELRGVVSLWSLDTPIDDAPMVVEQAAARNCQSILNLAQALTHARDIGSPRLWIATRGAQAAGAVAPMDLASAPLWGFVRSLAAEHPELRCGLVDLDPAEKAHDVERLVSELLSDSEENQIALRQGQAHIARLVATVRSERNAGASEDVRSVELTTSERGILENMHLQPMVRRDPAPGEVEIRVDVTGLNFRDVLNAMGVYQGEAGALGAECAGTISALGQGVTGLTVGQPVMAMAGGSFRTFVTTPAEYVAPIPAGLNPQQAATVPVAFLTAEYALNHLARMKRGDRVLIHAAAGGVGVAAVQLAMRAGAEVFATVGSAEKRAYLESIGVRRIMNSRTLDFADEIMAVTEGRGVDIVLNSLAGDFIPASLRALGANGRFVEIGKTDIWDAAKVAEVRPDIAYFPVYLGDVDRDLIASMLKGICAAAAEGAIRPLPIREFSLDSVVDAFRFMAQAKHIGKIVVTHRRADNVQAASPVGAVTADGTYLITGGTGALGLIVARGLLDQGARHIALVSRRAPSPGALETIRELEAHGAVVHVVQADVARSEDVRSLLDNLQRSAPPLRGIVHAAGVLDDGPVIQQSWTRFESVLAPKVSGALNLHRHSSGLPLDFFILFSSASAVLGAAAQATYSAANAFLDALAHHRRALGLPGISINWGPWAGGGMAASIAGRDAKRWADTGFNPLAPEQGFSAFTEARRIDRAQVAVLPIRWKKFFAAMPAGNPPALLADLAVTAKHKAPRDSAPATPSSEFVDQVRKAPAHRREALVLNHVREQVVRVLGLDAAVRVEPHQGLRDLGMDSLMAVELRNRLQLSLSRKLPATLAFDYPTIEAVTSFLMNEVLALDAGEKEVERSTDPAARARVEAEPIAIVGIGCRFPGAADSPDAFWELLHGGVDAISDVPADRWDMERYYDANPDAEGKMYVKQGGFLRDVSRFDAAFFGVSPREAVSLDPQQRLLLEVTWEALENAAIAPETLMGRRGGVFIGISSADYALLHAKTADPSRVDAYFGTGNAMSTAAGRLSYTLGLQGPCMSVDTACSSSLVAAHLASQSLRNDECEVALVGGVNLMLTPEPTINFCRARMLSTDSRCKTFDAAADGYVRAEGAGVIVLKRLSDAVAHGDRIYAVIRGSAVNQDGRSSGLTVPNGPAQQALVREALKSARVSAADISYVEAHGTGTSLGDPIEMQALGAVLADGRSPDRPLAIGSVKTNLGHLEAAAGIASLIKVALALQHEEIPPQLHFATLNPEISLDGFPAWIPTTLTPWPAGKRHRVAGVSSFGFSGTNAHVVVEEAPRSNVRETVANDRPLHVLALSAKSEAALKDLASRIDMHLAAHPEEAVSDVAFTANAGRSHFQHRIAAVASSAADLRRQLAAVADGRDDLNVFRGVADGIERPTVEFVFSGSAAGDVDPQLYDTQSTFKAAVDECHRALPSEMHNPIVNTFAIEYGLARLWQSWGVNPSVVRGRGTGEYVAACVERALSVEDALRQAIAGAPLSQNVAAAESASADGVLSIDIAADGAAWGPLLTTVAGLYARGLTISWVGFDRDYSRRPVALPTYPFQRQRYWLDVQEQTAKTDGSVAFDHVLTASLRQSLEGPFDLGLNTYAAKLACLDRLTTHYIVEAFRSMHVYERAGEGHTAEELVEQAGVQPVYEKLLRKWMTRLSAEGLLEARGEQFVAIQPLAASDLGRIDQTSCADIPVLLDYVHRCGSKLPALLTGRESALDALFPNGSFELTEFLYETGAVARYLNGIVRTAVSSASASVAFDKVRVLEVGAGTGGTTSAVLPALLPDRTSYWYTDVSDLFLARAQRKFAAYPFVKYGLLDLERDPIEQGFPARGFDVILGANIVHATSNLATSLDRLRSLLAPGGVVVLLETTTDQGWFDITTGLIEGWQAFTDGIREDSPLVPAAGWREAFLRQGFERVVSLPESGSLAEILGAHILIGRAPASGTLSAADVAARQQLDLAVASAPKAGLETDAVQAEALVQRLSAALPDDRHEGLVEFVRDHVAAVLRADRSTMPDRRGRLMDLGLDSLMAVELRNRLSKGLGLQRSLPATLMFDHPTIEAIATYLARELWERPNSSQPDQLPAAQASRVSAAELAELSDADVEALLIQKLETI